MINNYELYYFYVDREFNIVYEEVEELEIHEKKLLDKKEKKLDLSDVFELIGTIDFFNSKSSRDFNNFSRDMPLISIKLKNKDTKTYDLSCLDTEEISFLIPIFFTIVSKKDEDIFRNIIYLSNINISFFNDKTRPSGYQISPIKKIDKYEIFKFKTTKDNKKTFTVYINANINGLSYVLLDKNNGENIDEKVLNEFKNSDYRTLQKTAYLKIIKNIFTLHVLSEELAKLNFSDERILSDIEALLKIKKQIIKMHSIYNLISFDGAVSNEIFKYLFETYRHLLHVLTQKINLVENYLRLKDFKNILEVDI